MGIAWHGSNLEKRSTHLHQCSDTAIEVTTTYEGQFSALQSSAPAVGDTIAGFTNQFVEDVDLTQTGEADKATMTVHASNRSTIDVDESEWLRVDQDIHYHKNFSSGIWVLTQTDRDAVDSWEAENDKTLKTAAFNALSSNAKQLALRIQRGQTNYSVYIPIARRTNYYLTDPSIGQCGQVQTPLPTHAPNYQWVLTADRAVRRGWLWERVREWTGFSQIDTQIVNNA